MIAKYLKALNYHSKLIIKLNIWKSINYWLAKETNFVLDFMIECFRKLNKINLLEFGRNGNKTKKS